MREKHLIFIVGSSSVKQMKGKSLPGEPGFWVSPDVHREFARKAKLLRVEKHPLLHRPILE